MDSSRNTEATGENTDDLSALAWVQDELRRSLDAAHKALRRFVKETEAMAGADVDAVDPSVLRTARQQIHQGVGALELVGLPAASAVLRACEAAVQRFVAKPHKLTSSLVDDIERASFALLDYLARLLAGKAVSPLSLFPQYRAVQEAAGADRVHPADLWAVDWEWRELPDAGPHASPRRADAATRLAMEQQMLALMRKPTVAAAARMSDLCAGLGAGAKHLHPAALWKLAAAVFEAQAQGLLQSDVFSKRVAARLLAQLRIIERGDNDVSERLAQDLLFFCAQSASPGDGRRAPRLAAVRQIHGLAHHTPVNYTVTALGRFDPAWIAQARKRVAAAKESWSAVAGGEMHRMSGLAEQFALVGDSLKRLFPSGDAMAGELTNAVALTQQGGSAPSAPLAMEVATSLLYVEAALEDGDFDHPEQGARVRRLAERVAAVRRGATPAPLDGWMEDLYRRVSDRQTMGSVVQELRTSLSEAEKLIDQFFRNPADRNVLIPVPNQLSAMRGVLSVLGMDQASAALLRMRDEVDGLVSTEIDPQRVEQAGVFDRLAGNLGALGFLIDMLSVQPQMAKSLFVYDANAGTLSPVMGRSAQRPATGHTATPAMPVEARLIEQAQLLAFSAVREDVPLEDVSRDLERLSQEAEAADQPALAATVSQARVAIEQAHGDAADLAEARGQLSEALVDFVSTASDPVGLAPELVAVRALPVPAPLPSSHAADLAEDDEMRDVFLEEAREVLQTAQAACAELANAGDDLSQLTTVRRAFHTLKGSSRMVGLTTFGDAAWACEQLYNTRLADQQPADAPLLAFTQESLAELGAWVEDIAARRDAGRGAANIEAKALALREGRSDTVESEVPSLPEVGALSELQDFPPATDVVEPMALSFPPDLPAAGDLELVPPAAAAPSVDPSPPVAFELDLSTLDVAAAPPHVPTIDADAMVHSMFDPFEVAATEPAALPGASRVADEPAAGADAIHLIDLDLGDESFHAEPLIESLQPSPASPAEPAAPAAAVEAASAPAPSTFAEDEQVKVVGPLRISIPLFNIFLNEADELSRRLTTEVAEWAMELHRPLGETPIALAHSLAGSSATVGFSDLSHLSRLLEHALMRSHAIGHGTAEEGRLFVDSADDIRRLLHQFAAGFLKEPLPDLLQRLADHELSSARRLDALSAAAELGEAEPVPGAAEAPAEAEITDLVIEVPEVSEAPLTESTFAALDLRAGAPSAPATTGFGSLDSRFDPLGLPELKPFTPLPSEPARSAPVHEGGLDIDDDIDAVDAVDAELFPIFEEEGQELLPQLAGQLREWSHRPSELGHASACMRTLHTLKGGARLAGAMRLGEMAHRLESRIEQLLSQGEPSANEIDALQGQSDALTHTFEALRSRDAQAYAEAVATVEEALSQALPDMPPLEPPAPAPAVEPPAPIAEAFAPPIAADIPVLDDVVDLAPTPANAVATLLEPPVTNDTPVGPLVPLSLPEIDWSRFTGQTAAPRQVAERGNASQSAVRVRAPLLDRLVNQAGEVSITRSRIEVEVGQIKGSLSDLTDNLERLRGQLRDIELQGETQMSSRLEAAKAAAQSFDPLEFDRFTRFQELTRMMAESVNDVATVQRTLQRSLESTEDELAAQARMTRDLQDDLLRTRMVEFEGLSDRLYRVVRQAAKETGKHVRLDIVGGSIEVDRGVLDRMTGAFEHLLRNCVTHGIEAPDARGAAGKDATGSIVVALSHEGNEVGVEFRDDGAGLDLLRIRDKGVAMGLIDANQSYSDAELANLIFTPGFSTADKVTELAGRGIGMDVVRSEVNAMGGRIETATAFGKGTSFKLVLPLTTAVTQVVMMRVGDATVAVPSTLVEIVRRATADEISQAYEAGSFAVGDRHLPFFWLGSLLQLSPRSAELASRTRQVVIIRSAQQRIAVHVDEVLGNQEVVVKNLGPQLSHMPGLAGMTLLASGSVALIYNPVALATLYGVEARAATVAALHAPLPEVQQPTPVEAAARAAPLVLVVDDSLTVRRVTQRLLVREGYRVAVAKDGLDALERLAEEKPQMVLSDIEMPRMDGFDLVRNIRGDARLRDLPVIMITSRIAQKHRDYAAELGVDHYLGKPYSEEDLLALIGRYTAHEVAT
ncbi:Hpt domain-containing protein [Piscinibacter sp.]|uniref:hybrid sensor histidine kinase/response regulator n=1 Tax=Piscinibacter sp. TaxID=1903157 RepID=UPI002F4216B3